MPNIWKLSQNIIVSHNIVLFVVTFPKYVLLTMLIKILRLTLTHFMGKSCGDLALINLIMLLLKYVRGDSKFAEKDRDP